MTGAFLYLGRLLSCALSGEEPPAPPEGVSLETVWAKAKKSAVERTAAVSFGRLSKRGLVPAELDAEVLKAADDGVAEEIRREYQAQRIISAAAGAGVKVCPLKGQAIKRLYPSPEMRSMGDVDLSVSDAGACRSIMKELGYERIGPALSHHDEYESASEPLEVELHKTPVSTENDFFDYYADLWDRLIPTDRENVYALSPEDEYIYHIVHFHHHFKREGCGVRPIADIEVMRRAGGLDKGYISRELEKLGLAEFENLASRFADLFFGGGEPTRELSEFGDVLEGSGVYGSGSRRAETGTRGGGVFSYVKERVFRPLSVVRRESRAIDAFPPLIVGYWVGRFFSAAIKKPASLRRELSALKRAGKNK